MAVAMTLTTLGGTATIPEAWPVVVAGLVWIRCRFMHLVMGGYCKLRHQHGELLEAQLLVLICVQILHDMVYGSVILPLLLEKVGQLFFHQLFEFLLAQGVSGFQPRRILVEDVDYCL